jgi:hypothetical protein
MIKAVFTFEENKQGLVNITIEADKADETETKAEGVMLITFMALNNLLADVSNHKMLARMLGPEIAKIIQEEMGSDDRDQD